MASFARTCGVALRPHIKTHRIPEFAQSQIEYGAAGIAVAKVSQAEVMVGAGIADIQIAAPVMGEDKIERVIALAQKGARIEVAVDTKEGVEALSEISRKYGRTTAVLMEINSGLNRSGVEPQDVIGFASKIAGMEGIWLKGIMTHAGHVYAARDRDEVKRIATDEGELMAGIAQALKEDGFQIETVSVGSTPTVPYSGAIPGVTEIRPGNYIFYDMMQVALGVVPEQNCALSVVATVLSRHGDRAVVDAGSNLLGLDRGAHGVASLPGFGKVVDQPGVVIERLSEEHGILSLPRGSRIRVGQQVGIFPNHACRVMASVDKVHLIDGDKVEELEVAARGMSE
jgi:D-serine deaminase-like pyridoxal phosphate-dependent protein